MRGDPASIDVVAGSMLRNAAGNCKCGLQRMWKRRIIALWYELLVVRAPLLTVVPS